MNNMTIEEFNQIGSRMVNPTPVNDHLWGTVEDAIADSLKDIPTKVWVNSLNVQTTDRDAIYAGNDKITLKIEGSRVKPQFKGVPITGAKRTAVFQKLMHHSKTLSNSTNYGGESPINSNDQTIFNVYTIRWNNVEYDIGFIHKEDWHTNITSAYSHANYMRKHSSFDRPSDITDIKVFSHNITPIHNSYQYDDPSYIQEQIDTLEAELERWQQIAHDMVQVQGSKEDRI